MDIDYFGVGCCSEQGAPENEIKLSFAPLLLSPDFVECQKVIRLTRTLHQASGAAASDGRPLFLHDRRLIDIRLIAETTKRA
jgi:hypothetical protein